MLRIRLEAERKIEEELELVFPTSNNWIFSNEEYKEIIYFENNGNKIGKKWINFFWVIWLLTFWIIFIIILIYFK